MIRLALAEDDLELLESLRHVFAGDPGIRLVASAASAEELLAATSWDEVDLLLTDLGLPGESGDALIRAAMAAKPDLIALVLTIHDDRDSLFDALRAGAVGYILKGARPHEIIEAVKDSWAGHAPISPAVARHLITSFREILPPPDPESALTTRQVEILRLVASGFLYKEIADRLGISAHTVHQHVKTIYRKLQACDRHEVIRKGRAMGYVMPEPS